MHAVGVPYEVMNPEEVCDQRTYIYLSFNSKIVMYGLIVGCL